MQSPVGIRLVAILLAILERLLLYRDEIVWNYIYHLELELGSCNKEVAALKSDYYKEGSTVLRFTKDQETACAHLAQTT